MSKQHPLNTLDERVDIHNIDDVWQDGYDHGFEACLRYVREAQAERSTPENVEEP